MLTFIFLITGGIGVLVQFIGLVYYILSLNYNNEEYKETAFQCFVYGTVLLLGSGILCGAGMIIFN